MIDAHLPTLYGFALVLLRTAGLCMVAPVLGARTVPGRIRLALSLFAAFAAFTGAGFPQVALPTGFFGLVSSAASETALGLAAGLSSRLFLDAAQAAGQVVGLSMGLGFGALLEPTSGAESTVLGQLLGMLALGAAISLGVHREAFAWLSASVRHLPPGGATDLMALLSGVVTQAIGAVALTVRIAIPFLAAVTFGHFAMAMTSRLAPQLNLSSMGFAVAILAGGTALWLLAPAVAAVAAQASVEAFSQR